MPVRIRESEDNSLHHCRKHHDRRVHGESGDHGQAAGVDRPDAEQRPQHQHIDRAALIERIKRNNNNNLQSASLRESCIPSTAKPRHGTTSPVSALDAPDKQLGSDGWRQRQHRHRHQHQEKRTHNGTAGALSIEKQGRDAVAFNKAHRQATAISTGQYGFRPSTQPSMRGPSIPSSFVLLPPSSPLVQQTNDTDLDYSQRPYSRQDDRHARRYFFSSESLQACHTPLANYQAPVRQRDTLPCQAHQPRSSQSSVCCPLSTWLSNASRFWPRVSHLQTDMSSLQHAPMVVSYEESILHGRMCTTPSASVDFTARISVLGTSNRALTQRYPKQITLSFPAVFYNYNSGNGRIVDSQPSPYVGCIDLENALKAEQEDTRQDSASPKSPLGGCYAIPRKGQFQIIIMNPNNTAIKLFLVSYDLQDMKPGQKTFIRQRTYSTGPAIDMPLVGGSRLRYLIHLQICCPSKHRYFLYKTIRVVFTNRVPDDKEQLRNEIRLPDPRYCPYRPVEPLETGDSQDANDKTLAASGSSTTT